MNSILLGFLAVAAMICPLTQVIAQDDPVQAGRQNMLPVIQKMPVGLPGLAKQKQGAVFSMNQVVSTGNGSMNKGFFIDGNGLALCSLSYLCCDVSLRFEGSNGELLKTPKVLGVFASHHLALVKFAHKPKVWLEISDRRPAAGEWIALISTLRDPDPLVSPVLVWRDVRNFEATLLPETAKMLSFASGRSPVQDRMFAIGAPLIDETGKVIAVYAGRSSLDMQTLRFARPFDGISNTINAALRNPIDQIIPLSKNSHNYDPVRLDPQWMKLQQESPTLVYPDTLRNAQKLLSKYPESRILKIVEWEGKLQALNPGSELDLFLEATILSKPPGNAPVLDRAAYFQRLGDIQRLRPGNEVDAMEAYRHAFELAPQVHHTEGANLAFMHLRRGELNEAESIYREVITHVPERIDYVEALRKVLGQKGDTQSVDKLTPWVWTLEDLYRSR